MASLDKVGIVSIGEMGVGIAKLLIAHGYTVLTNITGRSDYTQKRAADASIATLGSDSELVAQVDYLISIVPPRDALSTAQRFALAIAAAAPRGRPLYYLDLNATSPKLARAIAAEFAEKAPAARFVDGGIIGGPPKLLGDTAGANGSAEPGAGWKRPSVPLSGPHQLASEHLAATLGVVHVGADVGSASGLKCCFASIVKGLIGLSLQSFSTAASLGVYDELMRHLERFQPHLHKSTTKMVTEIPPKAGRWVEEMSEIGRCLGEEGGWDNTAKGGDSADVFSRFAEVYRAVAQDTVLGRERPEHRERGQTADDVAAALSEALRAPDGKRL